MARIAFVLIWLIAGLASAEGLEVGPEEALERAEAGEITIVDIRLPFEWKETGLPEPAIGVSLQDETFKPRPGFLDDLLDVVDGDRDRPIALICASGSRSAFAQELLAAKGFTNVYNITEGVAGGEGGPGWIARDLPTTPCAAC